MVNNCVVVGCNNYVGKKLKLRFFLFPKHSHETFKVGEGGKKGPTGLKKTLEYATSIIFISGMLSYMLYTKVVDA